MVKPEKAKRIEDIIIQNAQQGRITTRLDESAIINYIEQLNNVEDKNNAKISFKRKVCNDSDDDYGIDPDL